MQGLAAAGGRLGKSVDSSGTTGHLSPARAVPAILSPKPAVAQGWWRTGFTGS